MRLVLILFICLFVTGCAYAQNFSNYFTSRTLHIGYLLTGNAEKRSICLDELSRLPTWAGRRHHLAGLPLEGNGQIAMCDVENGKVIYTTSFSSLFQGWLETDKAKEVTKGSEDTYLLPYPVKPAEVEITLRSSKREVGASPKRIVRPNGILIHKKGLAHITPHKYLLKSGNEEQCIDMAILAKGYTKAEMETFCRDATVACEALFSHEPFQSMKNRFNIIAVANLSVDSRASAPKQGTWRHTVFDSHFDTFCSNRYLTTSHVEVINDALAGISCEHIIIPANTEQYGGGGIRNAFTLTTTHYPNFRPVVVHEFGHSFGGLTGEYSYDENVMNDLYPLNIEPWEQNITTRVNLASKWKGMLTEDTPVPTPIADKAKYPTGVYERGGYSAKGIYRPVFDCRMRINEYPIFCPVCQGSIRRVIEFYTSK